MNSTIELNNEQKLYLWYELYFSNVFNYGLKLTIDEDIIKNSMQEVFIHLSQNLKLIEDIKDPKVYLYTSLRCKIILELKKKYNYNSVETMKGNFEVKLSSESGSVFQKEFNEDKTQFTECFNKLTFYQKEALLLRFSENLSYYEISQTMQLQNVNYARELIYTAIKKLKTKSYSEPT